MPLALLVPNTLDGFGSRHKEILQQGGFSVETFPAGQDPFHADTLSSVLERGRYDAVLAGSEPYTPLVLSKAAGLRVIARVGVGYDAVDLPAATQRRIAVTITPGTNDDAVAEHTLALLLCVGRDLVARDQKMRRGQWARTPVLPPVRGRTLGILGLGRIGRAVAVRAKALGMEVVAYEPYPHQAFVAEHAIRLLPMSELFAIADYVTLHLPLSEATNGLINRDTLAQMKRGSVLINTARGGLIVEADLAEAIRSGHLGAAALDVFQREPPDRDNPLLQLDRILLTPHVAGIDTLAVARMAEKAAQVVVDLYQGRWLEECVVNPQIGPNWKW